MNRRRRQEWTRLQRGLLGMAPPPDVDMRMRAKPDGA